MINQINNHIKIPLISIFVDLVNLAIFPRNLKLVKVAYIFKSGKIFQRYQRRLSMTDFIKI